MITPHATHFILHVLRNPSGHGEDVVRAVRLEAAERIEKLEAEVKRLADGIAALYKELI